MTTYKIYYTNDRNLTEAEFLQSIDQDQAEFVTLTADNPIQAKDKFLQLSELAWRTVNGQTQDQKNSWKANYQGPLDAVYRKIIEI